LEESGTRTEENGEERMSFLNKLTDHAHDVFTVLGKYRNSARQSPISQYTFVDYCPELSFSHNGEDFTVFKAKKGERTRYVCYGNEDSLRIRSLKTVLQRTKDA
jgi:hypothetical protein